VHFDRLHLVSTLPPDGGWRADLAIDAAGSPPRAVLVVRVPPAVAGDALSLAMLARGVDLSSRVQHPALRRLLGTGEVEGELVLVEAWREGETLRGLIEAGGPLTEELAARVAIDLAGALHAAHTLTAATGRPLSHGAVRTERVLITESGEVLLCGLGRPFAEDATPGDDLRDLARLVVDCLPPAGGGAPGALAAVTDRVLVGEGYRTAAAFAEAVATAVTPADTAAVVARVEASQSAGTPAWLAHRRALAQALRAEGGAAAEEVGPSPVQAEGAGIAPRPATTPPPLPTAPIGSGAPTVPAIERAPSGAGQADQPADGDGEFVELDHGRPPGGPGPAGTAADRLAAWLEHPRAPVSVVAALGLVGLLLGFALGGR
jgi:hypothetical protein